MLRTILTLLALCFAVSAGAVDITGEHPYAVLTPGDVRTTDAAVVCDKTQSTRTVRNVPGSLKQQIYRAYGLNSKRDGWCNTEQGCEVDHLISLELGGSNDPKNLWPQPYQGTPWNAHAKDALENKLHALVCAGRMTLPQAQMEISGDWIASYKLHIGATPPE
jgi:hypothetical protein